MTKTGVDLASVGRLIEPARHRWSSDDALLYALSVGASVEDLHFTTESTPDRQQRVLPTFAVIIGPPQVRWESIGPFDRTSFLHAEQSIELYDEIPVEGEALVTSDATAVYDKGSGALIEVTSTATLLPDRRPLFSRRMSSFIRGAGGWGGDRGPSASAPAPPPREADFCVDAPTWEEQALLYRLSGDRNLLHSEPAVAARGGFDRPILHGLCTFGITGRVLLRALCGNDPRRFKRMGGRFSSPVMPGETLTVEVWSEEPGIATFRTLGADRRCVLDRGHVTYETLLRPQSTRSAEQTP